MQRRNDTGGAPAPIVAAENGAYDLEGVHQRQKVGPKRRLLARARGLRLKEPRRPVAAQVGNDHPRPSLRKDWRRLIIGMRVVREAMAKDTGQPEAGPYSR